MPPHWALEPDRIRSVLGRLPVSVNCQYGDPLQPSQLEDTLQKLRSLETTGHRGPVAVISKYPAGRGAFRMLAGFDLELIVFLSITGLEESPLASLAGLSRTYADACSELENVVVYVRPVIPGRNDSLEKLQPMLSLAAAHRRRIVFRGFKDVSRPAAPYVDAPGLFTQVTEQARALGVESFPRTSCAAAAAFGRPCATHPVGPARNLDIAAALGYLLEPRKSGLFLDRPPGSKRRRSRGDLNFLRFLCGVQVRARGPSRGTTLAGLQLGALTLDCSSSWWTWARQVPCAIGCDYCIARWNPASSRLGGVGCNPVDLMTLHDHVRP